MEKTSKDRMYDISTGKAIPLKAEEMEWNLRYGSDESIIKHRYYIAHIVNLYRQQPRN